MTDATMPQGTQGAAGANQTLVVPNEIQEKFSALVELIKRSESMNIEERQYWINILPAMTPEQLKNLQDILENEKRQLQAIDEKYSHEMERIGQTEFLKKTQEARQQKRSSRQNSEEVYKKEEAQKTDDILKKIEGA